MPEIVVKLLQDPLLLLLLIIIAGLAIGRVTVFGLSLGSSGVLFSALLLGHFHGSHPEVVGGIPPIIGTMGVVFFVYAVGLQAGPRFFKTFRAHGRSFVFITFLTLLAAALTTVLVSWLLDLRPAVAVGIFTGALTTTPGLAAALDVLKDPEVSVGYGVAYPFGVAGVVLFVQLLPRILRLDMKAEAEAAEREVKGPAITTSWFRVTNPNCVGRMLRDLEIARHCEAVLTRLQRNGAFIPALDDTVLQDGDLIKAAGNDSDLRFLNTLFGPKLALEDVNEDIHDYISREVFVSNDKLSGKTLAALQINARYGLVLTRLWRQDLEFLPRDSTVLEFGDLVRVVGPKTSVLRFIQDFGTKDKRLAETNFLPLLMGMGLGIVLGMLPLRLGQFTFKLGMAGGPLFVALIWAHFGRIGTLTIRVPEAARYFTRELGLMLFLASAGMTAGEHLIPVLMEKGPRLVLASALITIVPLVAAWFAASFMRVPTLSSLGLVCGAMTSTPGLGAVTASVESQAPAVAYAAVYPAALIGVTIISQILAVLLSAIASAASAL